ncbi:hypothetical protein M0R45_000135 [Rubus argutus]|uniref:Uncharacterized protein n=1 Tax=Rubus argutus TaxID=59490 RepID=A0AAW1VLK1_RUBAR
MKEENLPVNSGILNQVGVIGPQGWSHHLHNQVFGQVGQGSPQLRGSFRLELRLASQKLGNIDIGEACLLRYLTIDLPDTLVWLLVLAAAFGWETIISSLQVAIDFDDNEIEQIGIELS